MVDNVKWTVIDPPARAPAPSREPEDPTSPAGRVVHDERGNAVWNWSNGNNRTGIGSTSQMLRQLDLTNLQVEDEVRMRGHARPPLYRDI